MLTWLGLAAVVALFVLILLRITSVFVALTLVPIAAGLVGGYGSEIGTFAVDGIRYVAPTAALLAFAVVYFGVMKDAGLFEPIVARVVGLVGRDPVRVLLGTAAIATVSHLDGAGASTFMVTVPAMLPIYRRLRLDPVALTCTTAMAAGTMNMLPWAGPTTRAGTALQVSPSEVYLPLVAANVVGMVAVFMFAARMGFRERRRLAASGAASSELDVLIEGDTPAVLPAAAGSLPRLWWANAALTVTTLTALVLELLPLPVTFLVACAVALVINYPDAREQRERFTAHASAAMLMVTIIFAAGVFIGVVKDSGMLGALANSMVAVLPGVVLAHLPLAVAVTSMPLSLAFDPDSFYFGVLPVLANAAVAAGGSAVEVGRAAVLGQMTTGFPVSPLTPSTFLLVGLAGVDFVDHQRRTIPYVFAITLIMTAVAFATGAL